MKKEMTLNCGHIESSDERAIIEMIADTVRTPQEWLRKYYSAIIGRNVDRHLAGLITRTQLAFVAVVVLAPQSIVLGLVAAGCFAASLWKCKKEL